jgi:hypothetical protein
LITKAGVGSRVFLANLFASASSSAPVNLLLDQLHDSQLQKVELQEEHTYIGLTGAGCLSLGLLIWVEGL